MTWSLNEIEALARKAARGSGYSWGVAEEAGAAVRWLEARGLSGTGALCHLLNARAGAPDGACCSLSAGIALTDAGEMPALPGLRIGPVLSPMLLLPFVAWLADKAKQRISLRCGNEDAGVTLDCGALCDADMDWQRCGAVLLLPGATRTGARRDPANRATCGADRVAALSAFAGLTYAPATEESRLAGAGAGVSDTD